MTKKKQSFLGEIVSEIKSESHSFLFDVPKAIAKYPAWRQIITWPLYIGLVLLIATISLIALLYLVGSLIMLIL